MRAVVIGTGKMGKLHTRIYQQLGVLAGVFDEQTLSAHEVAKQYNTSVYNTLDEVLASKPDMVTIATPTPTHHNIAIQCINANIHTLIEKPIAMDLQSARDIQTAAKDSKSIVTVGYIERHNPVFKELLYRINDQQFGDITSINIKRVGGVPRSADNVVMDVMTHDLNLLLAIFKKYPQEIYSHRREQGYVVHSAQTLLDFGTASATCEANWVSPTKIRTIALTGTESYAEVDMMKQEIKQFYHDKYITNWFNEEPLKNELHNFLLAIQGLSSDLVSVDNAIDTLRLTQEVCAL